MSKEIVILCFYIATLVYIILTRQHRFLLVAAVGLGLSLTWSVFARSVYGYNTETIILFGVSLYPLVAWSFGLLIGYMFYSLVKKAVSATKWWQELALFNVLYVPILIALETIAYHVFDVVNVATSGYDGLPLCECMHAPLWMQAFYFMMGSIFLITVRTCLKYLDSRNDNFNAYVEVP